MKIIKYKKLNGNKYELLLDNNESIKLYEDIILKEELLLKKEITDIDEIIKKNNVYEIYEIALKRLNHHVESVKGIEEYLQKKGYLPNDIKDTINKLINKGYLNDEYFAKCYISNQVNLSNDGPLKIKKYLENNNIDYNLYSKYIDEYQDIWPDRIDKYVTKQLKLNKKSSYYFKNKMLINLVNLGYDKEMINDCLNKVTVTNQNELKEKEKEKLRNKLSKKYEGKELERKIREKLFQKGFYDGE